MNQSLVSKATDLDDERYLPEIVEQFADQLRLQPDCDIESFLSAHQPLADRARPVLQAVQAMSGLARVQSSQQLGMVLGDFATTKLLGRGGMGEVYEARQISLQRPVALKLLLPHDSTGSSQPSIDRFRNEARAAAALDHPHIVPVYHSGHSKDRHFIVMKLIEGSNWKERIARYGQWDSGNSSCLYAEPRLAGETWREVVEHARDVALALEHAHQRGIIHRDIKPSNLLIDRSGKTWISDFGLASFINSDSLTLSGAIFGTVRYMSPERASAGRVPCDHRCDIYSLGATLYEMLTGRPAIDSDTYPEQIQQLMAGNVLPLMRSVSNVPIELETIVSKMMAVEPADRFRTAQDVADDLQRLLDGHAIVARPLNWSQRAVRWSRKRIPLLFGMFVLISILLVATFSLLVLEHRWRKLNIQQTQELMKQKQETQQASSLANVESQRAKQAENSSQLRLVDSMMSLAHATSQSNFPGRKIKALELIRNCSALVRQQHRMDDYVLPLRNLAIHALAQFDLEAIHRGTVASTEQPYCAVDSGFNKAACIENGSHGKPEVVIRAIANGLPEICRLTPPPSGSSYHQVLNPRFSPDGNFLAVGIPGGRIAIWQLATGQIVHQVQSAQVFADDFDFSPDSRYFAAIQKGHQNNPSEAVVYCLENCTEQNQGVLRIKGDNLNGVGFLPTGEGLTLENGRGFSIHQLVDGRELYRWTAPEGDTLHCIAASSDGRILGAGLKKRILVWERDHADAPPVELRGHDGVVHRMNFHPQNSSILASSSWDNTVRIWNVDSATPQIVMAGTSFDWASDGSQIAVADHQELVAYRTVASQVCRATHQPGFDNEVFEATYSHDGRFLATTGDSGLQIRDASTTGILTSIPWRHFNAKFSPQTGSLITAARTGVFEWPIHSESHPSEQVLQIGPAKDLFPLKHDGSSQVSISNQGDVVWNLGFEHTAHYFRPGDRQSRVIQSPGLIGVSLSPKGWTARVFISHIEIWDESTDVRLRVLDNLGAKSRPTWSADGRLLAYTNHRESVVLNTSDWTEILRIPEGQASACVALNASGTLAVVPLQLGKVALYELAKSRRLAEFDTPMISRSCGSIAVEPSGRSFIVSRPISGFEQWDLQATNRELALLGLEWESSYSYQLSEDEESLKVNRNSLLPKTKLQQGEYESYTLIRQYWKSHLQSLNQRISDSEGGLRDVVHRIGRLNKIISLCNDAITANPTYAWAYSMRAQCKSALNLHDQAVADWERAVELFPNPFWNQALKQASEKRNHYRTKKHDQ